MLFYTKALNISLAEFQNKLGKMWPAISMTETTQKY